MPETGTTPSTSSNTGTQTINTVGWLSISNNTLLLVRTRDNEAFYVPGGKLEASETPEAALLREVTEELTVSLIPNSLEYTLSITAPAHGRHTTEVCIACYRADFIVGGEFTTYRS